MSYSHVAHDCVVGNHVVMVNNSGLSGEATVGERAFLGGRGEMAIGIQAARELDHLLLAIDDVKGAGAALHDDHVKRVAAEVESREMTAELPTRTWPLPQLALLCDRPCPGRSTT